MKDTRSEREMCLKNRGGSPAEQERMACAVMKSGDNSLNSTVRSITGKSNPDPLKAARGGKR